MNSIFKSKIENLINSSHEKAKNKFNKINNLNNEMNSLKHSYSSPKYSILSFDNNNEIKKNMQDILSSSFIEYTSQTSKSIKSYGKDISLKKHNNSKLFDIFNKNINRYSVINDKFNNDINKSFNIYNIPNNFSITRGKNLKEKIFDFTNQLKSNNNSFVNRPISKYNNYISNEYFSPLNKMRIKNLSKGKSITNLFNDSNNINSENKNDDLFKIQFSKKKKLIVNDNHKKVDNKKIIQDYMKEFAYPYYKKNIFKPSKSNKVINLNF
jgi:hypothetical protein